MVFERPDDDVHPSFISLTTLTGQNASLEESIYINGKATSLSPSTDQDYGNENLDESPLGVTNLHSKTVEQGPNGPKANTNEPPYHIFSHRQKWYLVMLVSIAGSFSPLSSNIYFPAVDSISSQLHVSASLIALTITVYMIVQAFSPSLWGPMSDASGRRITFATTLIIYTVANLALAFTSNFPMLLMLRGVQAMGSAATISISAGVIADMATPGERGGFMGTNAGIRMVGQAVGPVIGGLLNSKWGFRSIFWLLFVMSILVLVLLLVFLPETQRKLAGNGSLPLRGFHLPWLYLLRPPKSWALAENQERTTPKTPHVSLKSVLVPFKHILEKDIFVLLSWGSLVYAGWSMVTSSTTTILLRSFPDLTQSEIGLCFLPNGAGCVLGSMFTGWILDKTFKRVEAEYKQHHGLPETANIRNRPDFPYERARLRLMPYFSLSFIVSIAVYGPSFELNDLRKYFAANLVASLGLQFMIAFTATAIFNINSTMLVDCFPDGSASATATNNLCRCLVGAAGVSVIQPLIGAVKLRNAFLVLTGVVVLFSPLVWVQRRFGPVWRQEREGKMAKKLEQVNLGEGQAA